MDNNKVMIVGTGNVGASIAFAIMNQRTAVNEIVLTDIIAKDAEGEAMDLRDALAVAPSYVKVSNGTYKDARDCDVVVITAGAPQKPGETRMDLIKKNANILKGMIDQIMASGFDGIFLVLSYHEVFWTSGRESNWLWHGTRFCKASYENCWIFERESKIGACLPSG